jgi:hypothetical protein
MSALENFVCVKTYLHYDLLARHLKLNTQGEPFF